MVSINYNEGKETVIKLFEVKRLNDLITEKYQGQLGWFFDDVENPITPPKGVRGIHPARKETYLEIHYQPKLISENEVKDYLLSLGIETGLVEEYKMTFGMHALKWLLAPFVFIFAVIILGILKVTGNLKKPDVQ